MNLNFRKLTETERKNGKPQTFTEIKGKITEQHLKNEIVKLVVETHELGHLNA